MNFAAAGTSSAGAAIAAAAPEASTAHQDHTASEFIDYSNQSEEISSSRANFDNDDLLCEDEPCSNIEPETEQDVNDNDSSEQQDHVATRTESPATKKQKKSRKNLRQKLKSNRATRRAKSGGHSAEVKYSCTVCDKSFPQEQQLIKHLRFLYKRFQSNLKPEKKVLVLFLLACFKSDLFAFTVSFKY